VSGTRLKITVGAQSISAVQAVALRDWRTEREVSPN
jgi:hypothetical protein